MRRFLHFLQQAQRPTADAARFADRVGQPAFEALLHAELLEPIEPTWYPCATPGSIGCTRRIVENPGDPKYPYVAVCDGFRCDSKRLTSGDLVRYTITRARLTRGLRKIFELDGPAEFQETAYPDTFLIGTCVRQKKLCNVFLALRPHDPGFPMFLAALQLMQRGSLVLVPTAKGIPIDVVFRHGPGRPVELLCLDDVLVVRDGELAVEWTPKTTCGATAAASVPDDTSICVLMERDGERRLSPSDYKEIVARAQDYDLFVDAAVAIAGGRYGCYSVFRADAGGKKKPAALRPNEALALIELAHKRAPMRASMISALKDVSCPEKVVETMRRKIEEASTRFSWRVVHTIRGDTKGANEYQFNPPAGFKYALLRPLVPDEREHTSPDDVILRAPAKKTG